MAFVPCIHTAMQTSMRRCLRPWIPTVFAKRWLRASAISATQGSNSSVADEEKKLELQSRVSGLLPMTIDNHILVASVQYGVGVDGDDEHKESAEDHDHHTAAESSPASSRRLMLAISLGQDITNFADPVELVSFELEAEDTGEWVSDMFKEVGARGVATGEVDALGKTSWTRGFFLETSYGLFDLEGLVCRIGLEGSQAQPALFCREGDPHQTEETSHVLLRRVEDVRLRLSKDCQNLSLAVGVASEKGIQEQVIMPDAASIPDHVALSLSSQPDDVDAETLLELMVSTEWAIKAAGLLAAEIRRLGTKPVGLRMSSWLLPDRNPWIKQRNAAWQERLKRAARQQGLSA